MRRVKVAILICIVVMMGFVLVNLWVKLDKKKSSTESREAPKVTNEHATMTLEKIRFVEDKQGRVTWELEAKSIEQHEDQKMMILDEVKVTVYTNDHRTFVLTGKGARVFQDTKNVDLWGDVVVTSNDGYSLKTQSATYNHQERRVKTSDPVEIEGEQIHMTGRGMIVDLEARTFKILDQVRTQLKWKGRG